MKSTASADAAGPSCNSLCRPTSARLWRDQSTRQNAPNAPATQKALHFHCDHSSSASETQQLSGSREPSATGQEVLDKGKLPLVEKNDLNEFKFIQHNQCYIVVSQILVNNSLW